MIKRAFGFSRLFIMLTASVVITCDSFQEDIVQDSITINTSATDYYILSRSSTIIDLKSLISSTLTNLTLSVTENPIRGNLKSLNEFLLMYTPSADFTVGTDQFVVDVTNSKQRILKRISIIIHMELDAKQLPCGFAVEDLVCNTSNETIPILFRANDQMCALTKENIETSIYLGPEHGSALLKSDTIFYTPTDGYEGSDQIIYKLVTNGESIVTSYGVISIPSSSVIQFEVSSQNINEGTSAIITIPFDERIACDGVVRVKVSGNAVYGKLYTTIPAPKNDSIEVPVFKGQASAQIIVATIDNELLEKSKDVTFTLIAPDDGFQLGENNSLTITIGDDEGPSLVNFAVNEGAVNENDPAGITIQIPFSSSAKGEGSISIQIEPGQAVYGTNFITVPAAVDNVIALHVANKQAIASFKVVPMNNDLFNGNFVQTFSIGMVGGVLVKGNNLTYSVTVTDDELPSFANFSTNAGSVSENSSSGMVIQIPLSSPAKGEGSISIAINSGQAIYGTDFTTIPAASGNSIALPVVHGETSVSFTVLPINDDILFGNYSISFTLNAVTGVIRKGTNLAFSLTIIEDEEFKYSLVSFEKTGLSEPVCDDYDAGCVQYPISEGRLSEVQSSGIVVPIIFSEPAVATGTITISINTGGICGTIIGYGATFTTNPAPTPQGTIVLPVVAGDVGSSFTIFPIDDNFFIPETPLAFNITSVSGCIQIGEIFTFYLKIIDDEIPSVANFTSPAEPISEGDANGRVVEILFNRPIEGSGSVTVWASPSGYGTYYRTEPAFTQDPNNRFQNIINWNVGPGETGVSFKVIPVHNPTCGSYQLHFNFWACGLVTAGEHRGYINYINNVDEISTITFAESDGSISEANSTGIPVTLNFSNPLSENTTLYLTSDCSSRFTTIPQSICYDDDYGGQFQELTLSVPKNSTSVQFTIIPVNDTSKGNTVISIRPWYSNQSCTQFSSNIKYTLTILDDD